MKNRIFLSLFAAASLSISTSALAASTYTIGKSVINADRNLTFTNLEKWTSLSNYQEDGIIVNGDGSSYSYVDFKPFAGYDDRNSDFHYVAGGSNSYVTIKGANKEIFLAVGFVLGNGYVSHPSNYVTFQTYLNGLIMDGGQFQMANGLIKFEDKNGFDELRVSSSYYQTPFGGSQAIALDDLKIDIKDVASNVPEPGSLALLGLGIIGLLNARRRKTK